MAPTERRRFEPQRLGRFNDTLAIFLADFPIYYVEAMSERHILLAGGGGSAKTGVFNQINILELVPTNESCAAVLTTKYHTPSEIPDAIMTGALMRDLPSVGTRFLSGGSLAAIYYIDFDSTRQSFDITNYELMKEERIKSEIKSLKYISNRVLTGEINGQLTIWDVSKYDRRIIKQAKEHSKEIDEIDVDLVKGLIVSLSRSEGRLLIWNLDDLSLIKEFKKDAINKQAGSGVKASSLNYRSCKFAYDTTLSEKNSSLLVACNPIPAKGPSWIHKWSSGDFKPSLSKPVTSDGIMAMTVSRDGKHVAIGTRSGGVLVFEVRGLKQVYKIEGSHNNAVTSLAFLPSKEKSLHLADSKIIPLISASLDRRIVLHRTRKGSWILNTIMVILIVFVIYFIFVALHNYFTINT